jgi:glycosyltransferase involved in cell wall biosynthesis
MAEILAALGHRPRLLVPNPPDPRAPGPPADFPGDVSFYRPGGLDQRLLGGGRAVLKGYPFQTAFFASRDLHRQLRRLAPRADLVVLQLVRLAPYLALLEALPAGPPVMVDFIDSLALNFQQWAGVTAPPKRWLLAHEAARLARWETEILRRAAGGLVVCERDRRAMLDRLPGGDSRAVAARLLALPLAFPLRSDEKSTDEKLADERQADEKQADGNPGPGSPPTVVLTGNLGYAVTVDGFRWWLREVWPRLRQRCPALRAVVAGARPARVLRRAAAQPGVILIPNPPELLPILQGAHLALAPLRFGAGQPLKILEAWQCGVPVVASPWAAAGTTGVAGEDFRLATTPEEWTETILELLEDPAAALQLVASARQRLRMEYHREPLQERLSHWLSDRLSDGLPRKGEES